MSYEPNRASETAISEEIKALKSQCADACYVNENNAPIEIQNITLENVDEKTLCYMEGLSITIEKEKTPVTVDNNLLTVQFLNEMKEKIQHVEELTAYTKGRLQDVDGEINRLKSQIAVVQQAKSQPRIQRNDIKPEHLRKAREKFHYMKSELHGLIHSVFPKFAEEMICILGQLMQERLNVTSSGYIEITQENCHLIELLKDMNIVKENPYNNTEIKINY